MNIFKQSIFALTGVVAVGVGFAGSAEAFSLFSDRSTFESQLDNFIVDDYSNPGYLAGDNFDGANFDSHTDTNISNIIGETQYTTTGFSNNNLIPGQSSGDPYYCAGCNGSFLLDFTSTSVGNNSGVFGVGFDIEGVAEGVFGTFAFVTFGDGSTDNFLVPERVDEFWGITSDLLISSIHFGLENGGANTDNSVQRMALDNLTIGSGGTSTAVPEPASTLALLAFGAAAAGTVLKKKQV
ncbi:MAG: PEP-CTERM sorting domain-containing protein, partial [Symploca sp. SIO1A3]|nr:PEP-CTERM sorting domain-containing protein [Symploca sp. SIO1A3]